MKYKIKSFIVGVKEARRTLCTTVYGQPARRAYDMGRKLSNRFMDLLKVVQMAKQRLPDLRAAPDKWRLVEDFTARYNSLVEIPGIAICLAERRNMVLRCFQDGFLRHVHKYLGFLVTDPVDMLR